MIKILFQLNELSFGGTTKSVLRFCEKLDRSKFEPFLFYLSQHGSFKYWRRKILAHVSARERARYDEFYVRSLVRLPEFETILGQDHVFCGSPKEFIAAARLISPDVIHFNRGEREDWYTDLMDQIPLRSKCVETNIFGQSSNPNYVSRLSKIMFVSEWLQQKSPWAELKGMSLYVPTLSSQTTLDLRGQLNLPLEAVVLGRISRPHLDGGDFILDVFLALNDPRVHLVVVAASKRIVEEAKKNPRIHALPPTTDENFLSRFYNSLDLLLHYRIEGETFGLNIAEAMIHGVPVVTHRSCLDNAQVELVQGCGLIAQQNDLNDYLQNVKLLISDSASRKNLGALAREKALATFEAGVITRKLEEVYESIL